MSNQKATQTAASIRYLLALNELDRTDEGVRSIGIAEKLGITKPSVHTMIKAFCQKGYVTKEKYEAVHLTVTGRRLAVQYAECYELLYGRIIGSLKLPAEDCKNAVCAVLSETPEAELSALAKKLRSDPCGACLRCGKGESV